MYKISYCNQMEHCLLFYMAEQRINHNPPTAQFTGPRAINIYFLLSIMAEQQCGGKLGEQNQ